MQISEPTATTAAIVLFTVGAVAYGGTFVLRVVKGRYPSNELQRAFFRAGHAHAGVLVILGLVVALYMDLAAVAGIWATLSRGVLVAAILMPAGFFLSVVGQDPERPNRLVTLVWAGAASLLVGVIGAGVGLLAAT